MARARPALVRWFCGFLLLLVAASGVPAGAADAPPAPAVIVFDSSGSMAAHLPDGRSKLDAARAIVADTVASWPTGGELGVIAYGHRRKNDCTDIETVLPLGPLSAGAVAHALQPLKARGMTPLSRALEEAAKLLPDGGGTIVLVSDGIETCNADPCAVAAALRAANPALVIDVVGFGVKKEEVSQLSCIAERAGGKFFDAKDADGLTKALATVRVAAVAPPPPPLPPPSSQPPPAPAPPPQPVAPLPPAPVPQPPKVVRTHFSAIAGALGAIVDAPVHWTVRGAGDADVYEGDSRALALDLLPGRYDATAAAANAKGVRTIEVGPGQEQSFDVPVEAGRLDLSLAADSQSPPYSDAEAQGVAWVLEPLASQGAASIPPIAAPSLLLAPGRYRVQADLKGLKADAEIDMKSGEATRAVLNFRLGTIDLEAVLDGAAEPLGNAALLSWRIGDGANSQTIEGQAQPKVTLPEGTYPVVLTVSGSDVPASAEVKAGEDNVVRVVVPGGTLALSARLSPQAPALDNWHDTFWTITPIETLGGATTPVEVQEPTPNLPLSAGRWHVTLKSGAATIEQDVTVAVGTPTALSLDVEGSRLTMNAVPASGSAASNVVYDAIAVDSSGAASPTPAFETGSSDGASSILPAGHWRITASDSNGRHAEAEIDLQAGEEKTLSLTLN